MRNESLSANTSTQRVSEALPEARVPILSPVTRSYDSAAAVIPLASGSLGRVPSVRSDKDNLSPPASLPPSLLPPGPSPTLDIDGPTVLGNLNLPKTFWLGSNEGAFQMDAELMARIQFGSLLGRIRMPDDPTPAQKLAMTSMQNSLNGAPGGRIDRATTLSLTATVITAFKNEIASDLSAGVPSLVALDAISAVRTSDSRDLLLVSIENRQLDPRQAFDLATRLASSGDRRGIDEIARQMEGPVTERTQEFALFVLGTSTPTDAALRRRALDILKTDPERSIPKIAALEVLPLEVRDFLAAAAQLPRVPPLQSSTRLAAAESLVRAGDPRGLPRSEYQLQSLPSPARERFAVAILSSEATVPPEILRRAVSILRENPEVLDTCMPVSAPQRIRLCNYIVRNVPLTELAMRDDHTRSRSGELLHRACSGLILDTRLGSPGAESALTAVLSNPTVRASPGCCSLESMVIGGGDVVLGRIRTEAIRQSSDQTLSEEARKNATVLASAYTEGIHFLSRFTETGLTRVLADRHPPTPDTRPVAVVIATTEDWNEAWSCTARRRQWDDMAAAGYRIIYREVSSDSEAIEVLTQSGNPPAALIMFMGHGERAAIRFGRDIDARPNSGSLDLGDERRLSNAKVSQSLLPGGYIVSYSCSTGEGRDTRENIANMLRRVFPNAAERIGIMAPARVAAPIMEFQPAPREGGIPIPSMQLERTGRDDDPYTTWNESPNFEERTTLAA